ncbi:MAG: hypothetical protein AB7F20_00560 [Geoalkalibacter sp.]|jgi:lactate permease|uniref:hypothetical protein n=1 Tax=Geoalkalibacter sp. TaxID=3041440 RepID=UPI002A9FB3FC|nr:hypothetical protein [Thermodesulfobacteriota bacterium]
MDLLLSLFPIALLIYLMTRKKAVLSYRALPLVAVILYILKLAYFGTDHNRVSWGHRWSSPRVCTDLHYFLRHIRCSRRWNTAAPWT